MKKIKFFLVIMLITISTSACASSKHNEGRDNGGNYAKNKFVGERMIRLSPEVTKKLSSMGVSLISLHGQGKDMIINTKGYEIKPCFKFDETGQVVKNLCNVKLTGEIKEIRQELRMTIKRNPICDVVVMGSVGFLVHAAGDPSGPEGIPPCHVGKHGR